MLIPLAPLFLDLDLGPDLQRVLLWAGPAVGVAVAGLTFAVGVTALGRRARRAIPAAPTGSAGPAPDPFVQGSRSERRATVRREGSLVRVQVTDADVRDAPVDGLVVDRSMGGLCLCLTAPVPAGTVLSVRPSDVETPVPWTRVEVRSSRPDGDAWEVGCRFLRTPPWSVLLLFG
jgi:hypothetical protein